MTDHDDQTNGQSADQRRGSRMEMIPANARGVVPQSAADLWTIAQYISSSGLAPKDLDTPQKVFVAIQMGAEVGMKIMTSLRNIAMINGRPSIWGTACWRWCPAVGCLRTSRRPFDEETTTATCTIRRVGRPTPIVRTFSRADAETAALWGKTGYSGKPTPWVTYPKRMLQLRARGFALRDAFPEALGGFTLAEEAQDMDEPDRGGQYDTRAEELRAQLAARRQAAAGAPDMAAADDADVVDVESRVVQDRSAPDSEPAGDPVDGGGMTEEEKSAVLAEERAMAAADNAAPKGKRGKGKAAQPNAFGGDDA